MNQENINFLLEKHSTRKNHRKYSKYKLKNKAKLFRFLIILFLMLSFPFVTIAISNSQTPADINELELDAMSLKVELNRLPKSDESLNEREQILKHIISNSKGTEEAQLAYWELADLYLDSFQEPKTDLAISTLEEFLKFYPDSNWNTHFKIKLLDLYENNSPKKIALKNQLLKDNSLPNSLKSSLN